MIQKQQVNQNTKSAKNESGRSMVEMLGVLAIMGVLAIGGIAGYRWAMDKYRSNDTIKELSERAVVYSQQMIREAKTLSSAEFNPADRTRLGYGLTAEVLTEAPKFFEIGLTDVPQRVCQNIVNEDWLLPVALSVNGVDDIGDGVDCGEETNAMAFVFHQDLEQERLSEGTSRPEETDSETESVTETESDTITASDGICPRGQFSTDNNMCVDCSVARAVDVGYYIDSYDYLETGWNRCKQCNYAGSQYKRGVSDDAEVAWCVLCDGADLHQFSSHEASCIACGGEYVEVIPGMLFECRSRSESETQTDSGSWPEETDTETDTETGS